MRIWLVEITGHDGAGEVVHRLASKGYVTRPGDTPANAHYRPHVIEPASYERHAFGPGRTQGRSSASSGEIVLANPDGALDGLRGLGFSGRQVRILTVEDGAAYATAQERFVGTMRRPEWTWNRVRFRIRDKAELFDVPACPALFEGDAVGPDYAIRFQDGVSLDPLVTLTRASDGTYARADGSIESFITDEPRIGDRGLLVEEERANDALNSQDLTGWTLTRATVTADIESAPDGTVTVDRLVETAEGSSHLALGPAFAKPAAAEQRVASFFVKPAGRSNLRVHFLSNSVSNSVIANIDLDGLVVSGLTSAGAWSSASAEIVDVGGGWRRVWLAGLTDAQTVMRIRIGLRDGAADTYTGDGVSGVDIWGCQIEEGARPSSYIAAGASPVVRAADVAVVALPDGVWDIAVWREAGSAFLDVTTSGGAGWVIPVDMTDPFVRDIQVYQDDALTPEQKTELLAAGTIGLGLGGVAELKGTRKPRPYGAPLQIQPPLLNPYSQVYGCRWDDAGERAPLVSIKVYVRGAEVAAGIDHATEADMLTASVAAGHVDTCLAKGTFRLGSIPDGIVTADVVEGETAADRTVAQIMDRLIQGPGGLASGEVDAAAIAALDTAHDGEVGIWLTGETTVAQALDALAGTVGAWWSFDDAGIFDTRRLEAPAGTPVVTLRPGDLIDQGQAIELVPVADEGEGVPPWRATVRWGLHHAVQDRDGLAGSLGEDRKAALAREWRSAVAEDSGVLTKHLKAPELIVDTLFVHEADAAAEAARLLALYGAERDRFRVKAPEGRAGAVDLGDVVQLMAPRLGLAGGKSFLVLGVGRQASRGIVTLELWG